MLTVGVIEFDLNRKVQSDVQAASPAACSKLVGLSFFVFWPHHMPRLRIVHTKNFKAAENFDVPALEAPHKHSNPTANSTIDRRLPQSWPPN